MVGLGISREDVKIVKNKNELDGEFNCKFLIVNFSNLREMCEIPKYKLILEIFKTVIVDEAHKLYSKNHCS